MDLASTQSFCPLNSSSSPGDSNGQGGERGEIFAELIVSDVEISVNIFHEAGGEEDEVHIAVTNRELLKCSPALPRLVLFSLWLSSVVPICPAVAASLSQPHPLLTLMPRNWISTPSNSWIDDNSVLYLIASFQIISLAVFWRDDRDERFLVFSFFWKWKEVKMKWDLQLSLSTTDSGFSGLDAVGCGLIDRMKIES